MANQSVYGCFFLEAFAAGKGGGRTAQSISKVLRKWDGIPDDELTKNIQLKNHTLYRDAVFSTKLLDKWLE
jgi:hypothetical protein